MARTSLSLLAMSLVVAPLAAQKAPFAAPAIASLRAQEGRRAQAAEAHLQAARQVLGLDAQHGFSLNRMHTDEFGMAHGRFQQTFQGLRVFGGEVITHQDAEGTFAPHTLDLKTGLRVNTTPNLTQAEALAVAHQVLAPKGDYARQPSIELVIYPEMTTRVVRTGLHRVDTDIDATQERAEVLRTHLAYHVRTQLENGTGETKHMEFLVDAHSGAILKQWDGLRTGAAVGSGNSQWYGTVSLNTNSTASGYEMRDMTRGTGGTFGNNVTTNLNNGTSGNGTIFTDADNVWGDGLQYNGTAGMGANAQTAAVDGHRGLQATWDFYKNVFGRNGIDNTGKATYSRMHYSSQYDNAFWDDSCFCMTYGDGASGGSVGEADLDTAGHEMTHGVTSNSANLTYSGESGGLNESTSDIFGTCVEFYVLGGGGTGSVVPSSPGTGAVTANYTMFENSWGHPGTALRYMYKPSKDGGSKDAWYSGIGSIDVHYSSGPMNRAWYFMSQGSSSSSSSDFYSSYLPGGMTGVGNDHAARIWYRALTVYLTASSNYAAARTAAINSAKDLYGAGSAEEAATWNAFAAINVGSAWTGSVTAPAITGQPASVTVNAGQTASFSVTASGTAPLSYQWRKNGSAISGATSASYTTPATTSTDNGATFSVVVTNSAGSATSNNATLTVTSTATAPSITGQPANATVNAGATATFSVTASGTSPLSYQWRKNGTNISGATSASYTTPATTAADNGATFSVVVSNSVGSATSNNATLTVNTGSTSYAEVESNNTIATANFVASTVTSITGNLTATSDLDYFAVTLAAGEKITVNMSGPSGVDWDLYLVNSAGTTLTSSTGSTTTESMTYTNSGSASVTVYIKVLPYSGTSSSPYTLALSRTTPPPSVTYNEVESNNTQATANAVADNITKIVGYIGSSTDNDYFNVNVAAGRTLTVNMTGPTGSTYDYDLYLYNAAGTQLAASEGSTTTESASWTNSGSATAVVTIAVKRYAGSSTTTPYNLAISR